MRIILIIGFLVCSVAVFGQTAKEYFEKGQKACERGKYEKAIELFSKAIEKHSGNTNSIGYYYFLGTCYYNRATAKSKIGMNKEAIKDLNRAIEYQPISTHYLLYGLRAIEYYKLEQYDDALKDYNKAINLNPNYINLYLCRADVYTKLKEYEKAISDFDKVIEGGVDLPISYYWRGRLKYELLQYESAIEDFNKTINLNSNNNEAYLYRGNTKVKLLQYESAIDDYNQAIIIDNKFSLSYYHRGILNRKLHQYKDALKDFNKVLKIDPNHKKAIEYRKMTLKNLKKKPKKIVENQGTLLWVTPKLDIDNAKTYETEKLNITLRIVGISDISKNDFKVYRNGQQIQPNELDKLSLQGTTFSTILKLENGENRLQIITNNIKSPTLIINYNASKPDLYLVTIAPNYQQTSATSSLKYTDDDARDVQRLFQSQGNKGVFNAIHPISLIGTNAEANDINKTMERLKSQYEFNQIKPQDVVLIYISAHGYMNINENETFYIKGDDYDPLAKVYTSVSAKAIMEQLANIKCKKLLFLDACYSGGFRDDDERRAVIETMEALTKKQNGIATFTSSSGTQKSYEHATWQNGAFTEALIEALNGKADTNKDRKITLDELESYLQNRVPRLVRDQYNEIQTPKLYINGLSKDLPIFVY
jgi:tetratricopeptide (TPR) repeat protein